MKTKKLQVSFLLYYFSLLTTSVASVITAKKRRWGVRPINRNRDTEGLYATLIKDMSMVDEGQFHKYTRMTLKQFNYLFKLVRKELKDGKRKLKISPRQRLMLTIHYLAEGCSMQEIAWGYRIGETTAHKIIKETCKIIWDKLQHIELPEPTEEDFQNTEKEFFQRWNHPNCIGAIDGKHINIMAPNNSGSVFFNYKKTFSIVLMATCDAYYRFTMVDIGGAGSNHDSFVFIASAIGNALLSGKLNIPPAKPLPNTENVMPHYLVGDAAFPLHENIMRPYPGSYLGQHKNIFNYRLSRGRRCIENAFGILSQRWRILRRPINASLEVADLIVQATIVLHNYLQNSEKDIPLSERKYCTTGYTDEYDGSGILKEGGWRLEGQNLKSVRKLSSNNYTKRANTHRKILTGYFNSKEGWVPWQEAYINRWGMPE